MPDSKGIHQRVFSLCSHLGDMSTTLVGSRINAGREKLRSTRRRVTDRLSNQFRKLMEAEEVRFPKPIQLFLDGIKFVVGRRRRSQEAKMPTWTREPESQISKPEPKSDPSPKKAKVKKSTTKTAKKTARKPAKKTVKKTAKKPAKKATKKTAKKPAKKAAKKAANNAADKTAPTGEKPQTKQSDPSKTS